MNPQPGMAKRNAMVLRRAIAILVAAAALGFGHRLLNRQACEATSWPTVRAGGAERVTPYEHETVTVTVSPRPPVAVTSATKPVYQNQTNGYSLVPGGPPDEAAGERP